MTHLQLAYEYLRQPTRPAYSTDPFATSGFTTGPDSTWINFALTPIPLLDRSHVDYYLYQWEHNDGSSNRRGGEYPSAFQLEKEDSTTGNWSQSDPPVVFHENSLMFSGPAQ